MNPVVVSVSVNPAHNFSKLPQHAITLLAGLGVEGDAHFGKTTQHRYLIKKDPTRANLTQMHLLHAELLDELAHIGFDLYPGLMGENIITRGIDLMSLPTNTLLHLGESAIIEVTGLRDPCQQLNRLRPGLMKAVFKRDELGTLTRNAGIMATVFQSGRIQPNDAIRIQLPEEPHRPLHPV